MIRESHMLHGNQACVLQLEKHASLNEDLAKPKKKKKKLFKLLATFKKNEGSLAIGDHKL